MMNMTLNLNSMQDALNKLSTAKKDINELMPQIENEMKKIGADGTVWTGDAAATYREVFNSIMGKFAEFQDAVASCESYISKYISDYNEMQAKVTGQQ